MKPHDEPKPKRKHLTPPPPRPWQKASFSFSKDEKPAVRAGLNKQLEAIYFSKDAPAEDMAKLDHKPRHHALRTLVSFALAFLAVGVVAWAGIFIWNPFQGARAAELAVQIVGPEQVTLGEEATYLIQYSNHGTQPLSNVILRLGLPAGFELGESIPLPADAVQHVWAVGPLGVGASGQITIKGLSLGQLGGTSALQVLGTYQIEGTAGDQTLVQTRSIGFTDTVLKAEYATATLVVAGDPVNVSFELKNGGQKVLPPLVARIEIPKSFVPSGPVSTTEGLVYRDVPMPSFKAGATTSVSLDGLFAAGVSGEQPFRLSVGRPTESGGFLAMLESEQKLPVLAGDLSFHVVVNGSDADRSLKPGETLHITVGYQNVSPETLKEVTVALSFESLLDGVSTTGTSLLDWDGFSSEPAGASSTKPRIQTLVFKQDTVPDFGALAPQAEGAIEITLPTLAAPSGTAEAVVRVRAEATIKGVGKTAVRRTLLARPLALAYRTDAELLVQARAFTEEGAPLGSGPLPPVAGETTAYRIFWRVEKKLHALDNLEVRAVLPAIARWTGKAEAAAGGLAYDEASRTVSWSLNTMPEGVQELEANFELELTPDAFDIGRFAQLLGETRLEARDAQVNEALLLSSPGLSTDLSEDEAARGKGVVRAAVN